MLAFSDWKADNIAVRAASKKRTVFKLVQFIKPFQQGGVPQHLARFLVTSGMLPKPPGADEWPAFVDSSFPAVTANTAPSSLAEMAAWSVPVRFDLAEGSAAGIQFPSVVSPV